MAERRYLSIKVDGQVKNCGFINWRTHSYISRRFKEHQFIKFGKGFGCSVMILNYLRDKGIETIIVVFQGQYLRATVQDFYEKGIGYRDGRDNQLILPLKLFSVVGNIEEKQVELE